MCWSWLVNCGNDTWAVSLESRGSALSRTALLRREVPLRVCTLSQVKTKQRASHVLPEAYTNVESFGGSGFTLSMRAQFAFYSMIYTRVGFNIEIPTDLLSAVWCSLYPTTFVVLPSGYGLYSLRFSFFVFPSLLPCFLEGRIFGGLSWDWKNWRSKNHKGKENYCGWYHENDKLFTAGRNLAFGIHGHQKYKIIFADLLST